MRSYPESFDSSLLVLLLDRLDVNLPRSRQLASIELNFIMGCMEIRPELSVMIFEVHLCFSWVLSLTYIQSGGFQVLLQKLLGEWDDLSLTVCKIISAVVHGCRQRLSVSNQSLMRVCSDHLVEKLVAGMSVFTLAKSKNKISSSLHRWPIKTHPFTSPSDIESGNVHGPPTLHLS